MLDETKARSKKADLLLQLGRLDSLLVAFSGGVDSSFLLTMAQEVLGKRVVAATASSSIHPSREQREAIKFARERGIEHKVFPSEEMGLPEFSANPPDRCYHCKKALAVKLFSIAAERGVGHVAHGANMDDLNDYRPGFKAAQEAGMIAPLIDANLGKEEIRFLARAAGLSVWDTPSMACLASRFPYGVQITEEKLRMVEEAEAFLEEKGFRGMRVRYHGSVARIEVSPFDLKKILDDGLRRSIVQRLREIGFLHVAVDLEGYESGKMNRGLDQADPLPGSVYSS